MEKDRSSTIEETFCDSQKPKIEEGRSLSGAQVNSLMYNPLSSDELCALYARLDLFDEESPKDASFSEEGFSEDEISVIVYLRSSLDHDCQEIREGLESPPEGIFVLPEDSYYRDCARKTGAFPEFFKNR